MTNNDGFWIGCLDLFIPSSTISLLITISYENSQSIFSRSLLPWSPRTRSILFVLWLTALSLSLILWPMVSQPVCLAIKHPSGAYNQIFITVRHLRVCWCGALPLTRGWVCHLQLLLALASTVILGSEFWWTHDHILLCQIQDSPFRHLLWLAGLHWRYSTLPPHRKLTALLEFCVI
jgi:hypothetical protein